MRVVKMSLEKLSPLTYENRKSTFNRRSNSSGIPEGIGIVYDADEREFKVEVVTRIKIKSERKETGKYLASNAYGASAEVTSVILYDDYLSFSETNLRKKFSRIGHPETNPLYWDFIFNVEPSTAKKIASAFLIYQVKKPREFQLHSHYSAATISNPIDATFIERDILADPVGFVFFDGMENLIHYESFKYPPAPQNQ